MWFKERGFAVSKYKVQYVAVVDLNRRHRRDNSGSLDQSCDFWVQGTTDYQVTGRCALLDEFKEVRKWSLNASSSVRAGLKDLFYVHRRSKVVISDA